MRAGDVAGDRQAEARAALVLIARLVEPQERPEHVLARLRRDARPVVVDMHDDEAPLAQRRDLTRRP